MARCKEPLTITEHHAVARTLTLVSNVMSHMLCGLGRCYQQSSRVTRALHKVDRALSELRSALDHEFYLLDRERSPSPYYVRPTTPQPDYAARPYEPASMITRVK